MTDDIVMWCRLGLHMKVVFLSAVSPTHPGKECSTKQSSC